MRDPQLPSPLAAALVSPEAPMRVREAAIFLGVSPQTVYLWVQARDEKILDIVRKGEQLQFAEWADFFLQNYSKPPIRAEKTHEANERAALHLKQAFAPAFCCRHHRR